MFKKSRERDEQRHESDESRRKRRDEREEEEYQAKKKQREREDQLADLRFKAQMAELQKMLAQVTAPSAVAAPSAPAATPVKVGVQYTFVPAESVPEHDVPSLPFYVAPEKRREIARQLRLRHELDQRFAPPGYHVRGSRAELPPLPEYREPKVKRWFRDPALQRSAQDLLYKLAAVYASYVTDEVGVVALRAALANQTPADAGISAADEARLAAFWTPAAKQALAVFEGAMVPSARSRGEVRAVRRFFGDLDDAYPGLRLGVIMERRTQRQLAKLQREFDQAAQSFGADAPFPIGAAPPFPPPRRTGAEVR